MVTFNLDIERGVLLLRRPMAPDWFNFVFMGTESRWHFDDFNHPAGQSILMGYFGGWKADFPVDEVTEVWPRLWKLCCFLGGLFFLTDDFPEPDIFKLCYMALRAAAANWADGTWYLEKGDFIDARGTDFNCGLPKKKELKNPTFSQKFVFLIHMGGPECCWKNQTPMARKKTMGAGDWENYFAWGNLNRGNFLEKRPGIFHGARWNFYNFLIGEV